MCRKLIHLVYFALVLGLATNIAEGADPNLVGWWKFDEGSGTTTYDSSGNGNDGILVGGATWAVGRFGGGIELDGSSGYVSVPGFELTTDSITFVIWLNGWKGGDWAPFISSRVVGACEMKFGNNDTLHYAWNNDSSATWSWTGGPVIPQDTWTMLAVTIDPNGATAYVYTDDGGLTQGTNAIEHIEQYVGALQIGHSYAARYVQGIVDEAAVFSRALTEEEIRDLVSGIGGGYPYVLNPDPVDGAMYEETWVNLSWQPGYFALSHDVYFSDNFDDVNDGAGDSFQGNLATTSYVAGLPGFAYPDGLVPGTTYYWRIDEVNETDPNSPWKGPVWSFWVPPKKAYNASPADETMFVSTDVILEWMGGLDAKLHTVYFGDNFDDIFNAAGGVPLGDTTFAPGPLELNKTYYWRVDEFDPPFTHAGDIWSFTTTIEGLGMAVMDRWENISTNDIDTLKDDPNYPNNPDVTETVTQFAWNGDNLSDYGARIEAWLYVPLTGDYTFWLNSANQGELWLSTDDDPSNVLLIARESTLTDIDSWGSGEEQSDPIALVGGQKYYILALWKESDGSDHCQVAWQGPGVPGRIVIPGSSLSPFEPMKAFGAKPADRAAGVTQTPALKWKPGLAAASHEVYFGAEEEAVRNASKASSEYQGDKLLGDESYDPGKLPWESTFFWRIDEVNDLNPESPWVGDVWSFKTADFLIIDEFEDYTDNEPTGEAIWQNWIDGFGVSTNGSQVGYVLPPYAEKTIVHGGRQSMPLSYNNTAGVTNSEAELKLSSLPRDWTEGGVATLSIWFQGRLASVDSFTEGPVGTFTMTGSGADIWSNADEFHFAYKRLTGAGSIVAKVDSVQDTDEWAKAGVMIRETLEPGSRHVFAAVTPANGIASQGRVDTDAGSFSYAEDGITAPHWVKLERDQVGNFMVFHSADGSTWVSVKDAATENIQMRTRVYVGLAVTSHDADLTCEAVFSDVTITGNVAAQQWVNQDIGIARNVAEPMYVEVSNATGAPVVVTHDDPAAAQIDTWTEWTIDLSTFSDQGIDLSDVDKIAIGLGSKGDATADGGSGVVFFDDIRLLRPTLALQP